MRVVDDIVVWGSSLTIHLYEHLLLGRGCWGKLMEEDLEERTHPYLEPDSSLLKTKVNHKCVVAYLNKTNMNIHVVNQEPPPPH